MRKIVLLSFANTDYSDSLIRLRKETEVFPFDERVFLTEKDLKPELRKKIHWFKHRRDLYIIYKTVVNVIVGEKNAY